MQMTRICETVNTGFESGFLSMKTIRMISPIPLPVFLVISMSASKTLECRRADSSTRQTPTPPRLLSKAVGQMNQPQYKVDNAEYEGSDGRCIVMEYDINER